MLNILLYLYGFQSWGRGHIFVNGQGPISPLSGPTYNHLFPLYTYRLYHSVAIKEPKQILNAIHHSLWSLWPDIINRRLLYVADMNRTCGVDICSSFCYCNTAIIITPINYRTQT